MVGNTVLPSLVNLGLSVSRVEGNQDGPLLVCYVGAVYLIIGSCQTPFCSVSGRGSGERDGEPMFVFACAGRVGPGRLLFKRVWIFCFFCGHHRPPGRVA